MEEDRQREDEMWEGEMREGERRQEETEGGRNREGQRQREGETEGETNRRAQTLGCHRGGHAQRRKHRGNFPPGSGNWRINKNWQNTVQCCNPLSMVFAGNFRMELPQFVNKDA